MKEIGSRKRKRPGKKIIEWMGTDLENYWGRLSKYIDRFAHWSTLGTPFRRTGTAGKTDTAMGYDDASGTDRIDTADQRQASGSRPKLTLS